MTESLTMASDYHAVSSPILIVELALITLLVATAIAMMKMRRLFGVTMMAGIYSLLSASFFVALDAVDVAFTEAAVGAGISTVLMLSAMLLTSRREKPHTPGHAMIALVVCLVVGGALVFATLDMPAFGDADTPANSYVGQEYVNRAQHEVSMPNIVTAVLASYRGYDTMGETAVIFTAGIAVMLLLGMGSMRGGKQVRDVPTTRAREEETTADKAGKH